MKKIIVYSLLILVIAIGGLLIAVNNKKEDTIAENPVNVPPESLSGEETSKEKPVIAQPPTFPPYAGQPILVFGSDSIMSQLPPTSVENYKKDLATMAEALRKNPYSFNDWLSVGIFKKFFSNYEGARDAWEYAAILIPEQPVVRLNLANLYGYYLKDFKKAEKNYLTAIALDGHNILSSLNSLAGFYRDFGLKEKALEYYRRALEINPNDSSVKAEIERLSNG